MLCKVDAGPTNSGSLNAINILQVEQVFLPPAAALAKLVSMELTLGLHSFPDCLAVALKNLRILSLVRNEFTQFPNALSQITTLQKIDLSFNSDLHLEPSDVHTLTGLPNLKELCLKTYWSSVYGEVVIRGPHASMEVMLAIRTGLPNLLLTGL